ncbi:hypothetical protein [Pandoraea apista]|uniref:hypothetical protein n=1 Tax=Pandoraea apista TaxID=93218 RepID=UPI00248E265C|nr:hypothetical protein [Pandoraea apista]
MLLKIIAGYGFVVLQYFRSSPRGRALLQLVAIFLLLKVMLFPQGRALVTCGAALLAVWKVGRAMSPLIRPFLVWAMEKINHLSAALQPLSKYPPDVPIIYGSLTIVVLLLYVLEVGLNVNVLSGTTLGAVFAVAALTSARHAYHLVRVVSGWAWSKPVGKAVYVLLIWIVIWISKADASKTILGITGITPAMFPHATGILIGVFTVIWLAQIFGAMIALACGVRGVLWLAAIILSQVREQYAIPLAPLWGSLRHGLRAWWRRLTAGADDRAKSDSSGETAIPSSDLPTSATIRLVVRAFSLVGWVSWALVLYFGSAGIRSSDLANSAVSRMLVRVEFSSALSCPGVAVGSLTAKVGDTQLSVATEIDRGYVFRVVDCGKFPMSKGVFSSA